RMSPSARIFDVATGKEKYELQFPPSPNNPGAVFVPARRLLFSDDSRLLAASDVGLMIWDMQQGREVQQITLPDGATLRHAAFSPDGRTVAAALYGGDLGLWELASGKRCATLRTRPNADQMQIRSLYLRAVESGTTHPMALAFSPDGRLLAEAGE